MVDLTTFIVTTIDTYMLDLYQMYQREIKKCTNMAQDRYL